MGWRASAAGKRIICASETSVGAPLNPEAVVIDVNAVARRDLGFMPASVSPAAAAGMLWRKYVAGHGAGLYYFAFDSPHLIPEKRIEFLATERYAGGSKQAPDRWSIEVDHMSLAWSDAFNARSTKARLWTVLAKALVEHIRIFAATNTQYIVDPPNRERYSYPPLPAPPDSNYGEADLKAACVAASLTCSVVMYTIDWDAVVQGVIMGGENLTVSLGNVFPAGDKVYYSKRAAPPGTKAMPEQVRAGRLARGCSWSHGFALLAIGGVDYCRGLKRFGYRERHVTDHLTLGTPNLFSVEGVPRTITFNVRAFVDWLLPVTPYRAKSNSIDDLNSEMNNMLYCLLYMALVDPLRPRGGPAQLNYNFFPGCSTAEEALQVRQPLPPIVYHETQV